MSTEFSNPVTGERVGVRSGAPGRGNTRWTWAEGVAPVRAFNANEGVVVGETGEVANVREMVANASVVEREEPFDAAVWFANRFPEEENPFT